MTLSIDEEKWWIITPDLEVIASDGEETANEVLLGSYSIGGDWYSKAVMWPDPMSANSHPIWETRVYDELPNEIKALLLIL